MTIFPKRLTLLLLATLILGTAACKTITIGDVFHGAIKIKRLQDARNIEFSEVDEFYIGRQILAVFLDDHPPMFDRKLSEYLNNVGQVLVAASARPEIWDGYRFIAYKSDHVAAYSIPGGFILVSSAMLELCDNEDQLAAVLGHEIGHAVYHHPLIAYKKILVKQAKQDLTGFLANRTDSNIGKIFAIAASIQWEMQLNKYSREQELDADAYSAQLMVSCGYNPNELINILRKLPRQKYYFSRLHPDVNKRVAHVKEYISTEEQIPPTVAARTARYRVNILDYM